MSGAAPDATNPGLARHRLSSQLLRGESQLPESVVGWMGAVQAQDLASAQWAVGLRSGVALAAVEDALAAGTILRLHVLRPTWHLVAAEDARWLIALTGPLVNRGLAARHRELELHALTFERSQAVFRAALAGGQQRTRQELGEALEQAGIATAAPQRLVHLLMRAELDGVLCSGAAREKQATYALLDERVGPALRFAGEAALAELARRYFASHGPALLQDFAWWSGLPVGLARTGIAQAGDSLACTEIDGQTYWFSTPAPKQRPESPTVHLLGSFDEYLVAYRDRSAVVPPGLPAALRTSGGVLNPVLLIDGLVAGGWRRVVHARTVRVTAEPARVLSAAERAGLESAARQYGQFLGLPVQLAVNQPAGG